MTPTSLLTFLLPLLGTFLGASVPVILGALFYRSQKKADRVEQLHGEMRLAFRDALQKLQALSSESAQSQGPNDRSISSNTYLDAVNACAMARLYASKDVLEKLEEVKDLSMNAEASKYGGFACSRDELVDLMRQNLLNKTL